MEITCHRCHETLRDSDCYCPVCGLPQLTYVATEVPALAEPDELLAADSRAGMSDSHGLAGASGVAWKPALKAAAMLAVPAGVLCSALTPIGQSMAVFWMVGAAAWAVVLYARRIRVGKLTMGIGARIGLVTGLFASWLTLAVNGAALWIDRFLMHQGGQMDSLWLAQVEASLQLNQQMIAQMGMANAESAQFAEQWRALVLSANGRAGMALFGFLAVAAFLVLFAALGGAVGARLLVQTRRTGA